MSDEERRRLDVPCENVYIGYDEPTEGEPGKLRFVGTTSVGTTVTLHVDDLQSVGPALLKLKAQHVSALQSSACPPRPESPQGRAWGGR